MDASITLTGGPRCKMDLLKKTLKETDIFIPSYEEAAYLAQRSDIYGIPEVSVKDFISRNPGDGHHWSGGLLYGRIPVLLSSRLES